MANFEHEYADFNSDGILERLRCQSCGTPVASLMETPSRQFPNRTFTKLRLHANLAKGRVRLSDGSSADVFLCKDCAGFELDPHAAKITKQILTAWEQEMVANKRPQPEISAMKARTATLKVLTKVEAAALQKAPPPIPSPKPIPQGGK